MLQIAAFVRIHFRGITARFAGERGQDLIEYALLSGLIAAALVGFFAGGFDTALTSLVSGIGKCIDFKSSTPCSP